MSGARRAWLRELEHPTGDFFQAFAALAREEDGARQAAGEAVALLAPRIHWAGYLPMMPHGLLGLEAVFRLRPLLAASSFLRALGTGLHALAGEARSTEPLNLAAPEGNGLFRRLALQALPDMSNVGHRAVALRALGNLAGELGSPSARASLEAAARWISASGPVDRSWHGRMAHLLGDAPPELPATPALLPPEAHAALAREICDLGQRALLERLAERMQAGLGTGDLRAGLVLAAAERQLEARVELEGAAGWAFVHLAAVADLGANGKASEAWGQTAALVNFLPADEEGRARPRPTAGNILDAILDGDAAEALFLAEMLRREEGDGALLRILAEAASRCDPAQGHTHPLLAVAAASELAPGLPEHARAALLAALAKTLAASQGPDGLGRAVDRALAAGGRG